MQKLFLLMVLSLSVTSPGWGQPANAIKVMSYNIRYDNPDDGDNRWENRLPKIGALLPTIRPDIIGFQEALFLQVRDLQKMLPGYAYVGVGRQDGGVNGEMVPIFYNNTRFDVQYQGTFWLSPTPSAPGSVGWDAALPRIATWAILKENETGRELLVVNTHLDHVGDQARLRSAALLTEKVPKLAQGRPFILMGDFNSTDSSRVYAKLTQTMLDAREAAPTVMGPKATYTGFTTPEPKIRIDYIFVSMLITIHQFSTITTNQPGSFFSDHLPISAVISW